MVRQPHASLPRHYRLYFPRDAFLRAICAVYTAAFASIAQQIRGLYGECVLSLFVEIDSQR
jgi:hypothetical protein